MSVISAAITDTVLYLIGSRNLPAIRLFPPTIPMTLFHSTVLKCPKLTVSESFLRDEAPMLGDAIKGTPVILVKCR